MSGVPPLTTRGVALAAPGVVAATSTRSIAIDRSTVAQHAPLRDALRLQVRSDRWLENAPARSGFEALGLGRLPADPQRLRRVLARVVRAQGLAYVERRVMAIRSSAEAQIALLGPNPHSNTLLQRVAEMARSLGALRAHRSSVRAALQPYVVDEALAMLDAARDRVAVIRARYFEDGRPNLDRLAALRSAAKRLLTARAGDPAAYRALHATLVQTHPILAPFVYGTKDLAKLEDFAKDTTMSGPYVAGRPLEDPLRGMLDAIDDAGSTLRDDLRDDPSKVWRLRSVVDAALMRHRIPSDGMVAALARDVSREAIEDRATWRKVVSLVAIGLGIAAAIPTGGASAVAASSVAAGVDAYELYLAVEDYRFASAAFDARLSSTPANLDDVVLTALGTAASIVGVVAGSRVVLSTLLERTDDVGDLARSLDADLGAERTTALFEALGSDGVQAWAEALGADLGRVVDRIPVEAWPDLVTTRLRPDEAAAIATLPPDVISSLAPTLKGKGLAAVAPSLDGATVAVAGQQVLVDGHLLIHPRALLRLAEDGGLADLRARWRRIAATPSASKLGTLHAGDVRQVEALVAARMDGEVDGAAIRMLAGRIRSRADDLAAVIDEAASATRSLTPRAEALARSAPELRRGLDRLEAAGLPAALVERTLLALEEALASKAVRFDVRSIAAHLAENAKLAMGSELQGMAFEPRLFELEHAVEIVREGRAAEGSTIFVGLRPGRRVQLAPGGPVVELPDPAPGIVGELQDIDVLYLARDGAVVAVEVKRSTEALWHAVSKGRNGRHYLRKFERWTAAGGRRVAFAFRESDAGALDRLVPDRDATPREMLEDRKISWSEGSK